MCGHVFNTASARAHASLSNAKRAPEEGLIAMSPRGEGQEHMPACVQPAAMAVEEPSAALARAVSPNVDTRQALFTNTVDSPDELSLHPRQAVNMLDNFYAVHKTATDVSGPAKPTRGKPRISTAASRTAAVQASDSASPSEPSRLTQALMVASARGNVRACCSFLQQGAELTVSKDGASVSQAAIIEAARHGHAAVVQLLCSHGADPMLRLEPAGQTRKNGLACINVERGSAC